MIKWTVMAATVGVGFAFAAGCWVGWKTTLKVMDSVQERRKKHDNAH
jgi:hypothetical protein